MLSIQPRWCELIAAGEKTMEVRKTRPKLETPFKCYIYCTKGDLDALMVLREAIRGQYFGLSAVCCRLYGDVNDATDGRGKVIGEFVCDGLVWLARVGFTERGGEPEYRIANNGDWKTPIGRLLEEACLTEEEIDAYLGGNPGFGWHISDLKIYDKPRKLDEFERPHECDECTAQWASECNACHKELKIKRPPQSWCYVEEYAR